MKNSIWQEFVLEKKTISIFAAIAGGSWLVGILGMLIFQAFIKNDKALFPIATVLLVGIGSIFLLFLLANSFAHKFNLAISMGRTRKSYLPSVAFLIFVIVLMVYVMAGIGFLIEKGLYGLLYHGRKLTGNMGPFLTPAWLLCYTVFETGLICLYGGLMKKGPENGNDLFPYHMGSFLLDFRRLLGKLRWNGWFDHEPVYLSGLSDPALVYELFNRNPHGDPGAHWPGRLLYHVSDAAKRSS